MNQISNHHISEFQGYLKCIARLCANGYFFGVMAYECNEEIDLFVSRILNVWSQGNEYLKPSQYEYLGRDKIESADLFTQLESFIFNGLLDRANMPSETAKNYATKMLIEDINEYYGLVSVSLNQAGVFHPLLSSDVFILNIRNSDYERALCFIVKIENIYVLTSFLKRIAT